MKRLIKSIIKNRIDKFKICLSRKNEVKKFKDKRRKNIYSKINLTKEQKHEIDNVYKSNYGRKIPYTWHKHYYAFTDKFDKNYFPELLYIPEFENYMNLEKEYCKVFSDKNVLPIIAEKAGIDMPKSIISCIARCL